MDESSNLECSLVLSWGDTSLGFINQSNKNMVVFILYCKADLEGIESLSLLKDGANLCFSVRNPLDQAETREKIVVDPAVLHNSAIATNEKHRDETPNHFAMKWRDATSRSTLRILGAASEVVQDGEVNEMDRRTKPNKKTSAMSNELADALARVRDMKGEDSGNLVPLLAIDCNGLEPYAFHPMGDEFAVVAKQGGKKFDAVDLSDGDWAEYDISTGSVSITNFQSEFQ